MGFKLKVVVKTLSGTTAETLGSGLVPSDVLIQADSGDTVYIGDSDVSTTTGFLLPTTPMKLGNLVQAGHTQEMDLSKIYVRGAATDVVRLLYTIRE